MEEKKRIGFDDTDIEKQWENTIKEGKELLAKETNQNYVEDFIKFLNEEAEKYKIALTKKRLSVVFLII